MSIAKPTIPKGTRDFGPVQMGKRNFIFSTIKKVFEKYGFQPLETPTMENLDVLQGKYGDEGDQLLFKVLNSGDFLKDLSEGDLKNGYKSVTSKVSEKGMRYDLTVPFARFVVMNRNELPMPFKRYQIQPVWRADRPQKGRYREFYQCDADVVGTDSLLCEAEIVAMINEVFSGLALEDYTIKMNNRKILQGIIEVAGATGKDEEFCVAIDKLDKIGQEKVILELKERGFMDEQIERIQPIFSSHENNEAALNALKSLLATSEKGMQGVEELENILTLVGQLEVEHSNVKIDITLARGLSYYTGTIFETCANNVSLTSSIGGGGRYDDLTGVFGLEGVSGVGFSFGVDRIYDVMQELDLFPESETFNTQVMIINFGGDELRHGLSLISLFRKNGIKCEIYPDEAKMKKQLNYANKKGIPFVILAGSREIESGTYTVKDMILGTQESLQIDEIISRINSTN